MATFITFKRWRLRENQQEPELLSLVLEEIVPHYKKLSGCLRLGLLHIDGTKSYLALQYWKSRAAWQAAVSSDEYSAWFQEYEPILKRWNQLMIFEDEWDTEDVLDLPDESMRG